MRAALMGENLGKLAVSNGWAGIVLNGFLRDAAHLQKLPLGVKALGTFPVKSGKRDEAGRIRVGAEGWRGGTGGARAANRMRCEFNSVGKS